MSFTDNWSDEEFIRQMKDLIGNEGDIHVTWQTDEEDGKLQRRMYTQKALYQAIAIMATAKECGYALICPESKY